MLDPGLVARARRWGLFASFFRFAFQCNKNVNTRIQRTTRNSIAWLQHYFASKYTMHSSKPIFTGSHGRCSFQITIEMSFDRR